MLKIPLWLTLVEGGKEVVFNNLYIRITAIVQMEDTLELKIVFPMATISM